MAVTVVMEQLQQYADTAWAAGDIVEIRYLPTERDGPLRPFSTFVKAVALPKNLENIEAHNDEGYNVSVGVLPRRDKGCTKDVDCLAGRCVWSDFDGETADVAVAKAEKAGMPKPTLSLCSGHGAHLYWRTVEREEPTDLCVIVRDVAAWLGADESVANPSRVMRLPGTVNWKKPVADCYVVSYDAEAIYPFSSLREIVPKRKTKQAPAPQRREGPATSAAERARAYVAKMDGSGEGGRNQAAYKVACVLVRDFDLSDDEAWPILAGWDLAANAPPLASKSDRELRLTLESARKHARKVPGEKASQPMREREEPRNVIEVVKSTSEDVETELEQQATGEWQRLRMPWKHLEEESRFLRAGTTCVLCGPPGTGKSFMAAHIALSAHDQGACWAYLPLEDRAVDLKFRFLAIFAADYRMIDDDVETVGQRQEAFERERERLDELGEFIAENPRIGKKNDRGETIVPRIGPEVVLAWIKSVTKDGARVVIVDPVSQIEFAGRKPWEQEAAFIRDVIAISSDGRATVMLVTHPIKRPGKAAEAQLVLDDLQGSAMYGRLCHATLILDAHDWRESEIKRPGNTRETREHNRTLILAKTRHATGSRKRIAFIQGSSAPTFEEVGIMASKNERKAF